MITRFENHMRAHHVGKNKVVFSKELEHILHCKGADIRSMVNELRCKGVPICSCSQGYFLASNVEDINETIAHLHGRIKKIQAAIDGLNQAKRHIKDGN